MQDNPKPVQYIIMNKDFVDSGNRGMIASQAAHASVAVVLDFCVGESKEEKNDAFDEWVNGTFYKVVLVADENQMNKIIEKLESENIVHKKICESSLEGKLTCIGVAPIYKENAPGIIRHLPLLK